MSSANTFKIYISMAALALATACASTSAIDKNAGAAQDETQSPKPSADVIASIRNTSPLEQANFWNNHYNLHPTDMDISLAYVEALQNINSYDRAVEVAKFTSVSFPDKPEVFMALGKALKKFDKPVDAVRAYGRVVELSPYDAAPLAAMGAIFDSRGDHTTAQMAYQRALALDPERPATLSNFGMSLTLIGELERAEEMLAKAVALPDATAAIRQNYALILGLQGKYDEAREIASIDAPEGVAERNAEFLRQMTGDNLQLQIISQKSTEAASGALVSRPAPVIVETPKAAPVNAVTTAALTDSPRAQPTPPSSPSQVASAATTTTTAPPVSPIRLRTRNRRGGATGGE